MNLELVYQSPLLTFLKAMQKSTIGYSTKRDREPGLVYAGHFFVQRIPVLVPYFFVEDTILLVPTTTSSFSSLFRKPTPSQPASEVA